MKNETVVTLLGDVGDEPRVFENENGTRTCSFSIAVAQRFHDRQTDTWRYGKPMWYDVRAPQAFVDGVHEHVHKGSSVVVRGRLTERTYVDRDGVERVRLVVRANAIGLDVTKHRA